MTSPPAELTPASPAPLSTSSSPPPDSPSAAASGATAVAADGLTIRALVSTKDAGVIIGKGGKNVAELREQTAVKAGISKATPGVNERILTVTGSPSAVAKAYNLMISQLVSQTPPSPSTTAAPQSASSPSSAHTTIRLLISHNLMGTIIGRSGLRIKAIQDASGARMIASKDMLPNSTERIVEVQGTPDVISRAIEAIGTSLLEDWERGTGTVLYQPGTSDQSSRRASLNGFPGSPTSSRRPPGRTASPPFSPNASQPPSTSQQQQQQQQQQQNSPLSTSSPANLRTQNISIPSDMVGCIIGRGGTKITEIRRLSGSKISIAKTPHDETGERMFTIIGTPEANEKALFLLYNQLESEKERRVGRDQQDSQD